MIIFIFTVFTLNGEARLTPHERIHEIGGLSEPLSVEIFWESALLLSGVDRYDRSFKQNLDTILSSWDTYLAEDDGEKEKGELILMFLHDNILTKYIENQTRIDTILQDGTFNCVSSAVYYMMLGKYSGLEVKGVSTKDHAFCSIITDEDPIDIETTNIHGYDPGKKKNFTDSFGNITGYSYVPPGNYRLRTTLEEKGLLSLILQNRIAYLQGRNRYEETVGLSIDFWAFLQTEEAFNEVANAFTNWATQIRNDKDYEEILAGIDSFISTYRSNFKLDETANSLRRNYIISLTNKGNTDKALAFIDESREKGVMSEPLGQELYKLVFNNRIAYLNNSRKYEEALAFIKIGEAEYGLGDVQQLKDGLINNLFLALANRNKTVQAETYIDTEYEGGHLSEDKYVELKGIIVEKNAYNAMNGGLPLDEALDLINGYYDQGVLSDRRWSEMVVYLYAKKTEEIASKEGFLAAFQYIDSLPQEIRENRDVKKLRSSYEYNYVVEIHNAFASYFNKGDYDKAEELLRVALKHVPGNKTLKQDLEYLE